MPRNRFERPRSRRERRKLFVIATEGKRTEQVYFEVFRGDEFRKNITIRVLPTKKGESAPKYVYERLRRYVRDIGVEAGDEVWAVVDVDQWGNDALDNLCLQCAQSGFQVAASNPCFELWLLLHQEYPPRPQLAKACERELERLLGRYDKSDYDVDKLIPHLLIAIKHARRLDSNPADAWPRITATRVYLLVAKLIED